MPQPSWLPLESLAIENQPSTINRSDANRLTAVPAIMRYI
jgi:hypothetical protein